jgi:hypothetical protein
MHGGVLHAAIRANDFIAVEICLASGVRLEWNDQDGKSALQVAQETGNFDELKKLASEV